MVVYIYIHKNIKHYRHICRCIYIYTYMHTYPYIYTHIHTYIHTYRQINIYMYIYMYIYIYSYTYIYTHTYTYTHRHTDVFIYTIEFHSKTRPEAKAREWINRGSLPSDDGDIWDKKSMYGKEWNYRHLNWFVNKIVYVLISVDNTRPVDNTLRYGIQYYLNRCIYAADLKINK